MYVATTPLLKSRREPPPTPRYPPLPSTVTPETVQVLPAGAQQFISPTVDLVSEKAPGLVSKYTFRMGTDEFWSSMSWALVVIFLLVNVPAARSEALPPPWNVRKRAVLVSFRMKRVCG